MNARACAASPPGLRAIGRTPPFVGIPISKNIEVLHNDRTHSHYIGVDEAWEQVRAKNAKWLNAKAIQLTADRKLKQTWKACPSGNLLPGIFLLKRESGLRGPMVMQAS